MLSRRAALLPLVCLLGAACSGSDRPDALPKKPPISVKTAPTPSASASAARGTVPDKPNSPDKLSAVARLAALKDGDACARSKNVPPVVARAGAKPFAPPEPHCSGGDDPLFCDTVDEPPRGADACFVANSNIRRLEPRARAAGASAPPKSDPWDGKTKPKYLDRIDAHLHLTSSERELLRKNGFVVLDRLAYSDYANAFHDIFQEELPLFVGVDPILHAVFRGTEVALSGVEKKRLMPALTSLLGKLRKTLQSTAKELDTTTSTSTSPSPPRSLTSLMTRAAHARSSAMTRSSNPSSKPFRAARSSPWTCSVARA